MNTSVDGLEGMFLDSSLSGASNETMLDPTNGSAANTSCVAAELYEDLFKYSGTVVQSFVFFVGLIGKRFQTLRPKKKDLQLKVLEGGVGGGGVEKQVFPTFLLGAGMQRFSDYFYLFFQQTAELIFLKFMQIDSLPQLSAGR